MKFDFPQLTLLLMQGLGLGIALAKHGSPGSNHNVFLSTFSTVLINLILWWGGFFS